MIVTLRQFVQKVSTAKHLNDALDIIVHRVKAALPIDACAVYLTDMESHQYVLMAADGFNPASIGEVRIDRQDGLLGMGVDAMSMSPAGLARVKLVIRSFTRQRAQSLLDEALGMEDGFAIHRLLSGAPE